MYDYCKYLFGTSTNKQINYVKTKLIQGPVVQNVVSLTSSLRVIPLTVLVGSIQNILIFFAEKL